MLNRVVLIGRPTKDPEMRYTPNGVAVTNFTIACDRPFTNGSGEKEADFIPIQVWRQTAEACANYLKKGRLCAVEGRIQTRHYDNNEGRRVYVTEVVADNVRFLDSGRNDRQNAQEGGRGAGTGSGYGNGGAGGSNATGGNYGGRRDPFEDDGRPIDISEEDLPF